MNHRPALAGFLLLVALAMTAGLGAKVYNLPDVAVAPGGTANTNLVVSDGTSQAAINLNIDFDPLVATPVLDSDTKAVGGANGFILRRNVVGGNQLRLVLYQDPTTEFSPGHNAVIQIKWQAVGAEGQSTDLTISTIAVSDAAGVSGGQPGGTAGAPTGVGGRILITTPLSPIPVITPVTDLTNWTSFQGLPFPVNTSPPLPWIDVPDFSGGPIGNGGVTPLTLTTTPDGTRDGFGGWGSGAARIPWVADSVYLIKWTFNGVTTQNDVNQLRFRVQDDVFNSEMEIAVSPSVGINSVAGLLQDPGGTRTYEMLYEPSDLTGAPAEKQSLQLLFDIVDFSDSLAGTITLQNVEVTRFNAADVNPKFSQVFPATGSVDFTNSSQWTLGDDLSGFPPFPEVGSFPFAALLNYTTSMDTVSARTDGPDPDGAGDQIGYFQEFGMRPDLLDNQDGAILREVVSATSPTMDDHLHSATIRMRLTDETQAYNSLYSVRAIATRVGGGVGNNRPPQTPGIITYHNYFTYPTGSNVQALLDSDRNSILAVLSLLDQEDITQGRVDFQNFKIESAPRSALSLP
jgi:hypothetical protein